MCNEGPVNVIYNIIKYINSDLFNISIITFIPEKENSRLDEFKEFPIQIYQLNPFEQVGLMTIYKQLKLKLLNIAPDELHAHCPRSLYLMSFLPKNYRKLYTIHIYPGKQQLMLYGYIKGRLVIMLNHFFTRLCDKPIGCSESVGWQYKKNKGWNFECVPNGCSLPMWRYDKEEKSKLRREFGLKSNMKYFIFIGRFSKEKNPDILVKAFRRIKRTDVGVILLGNGLMWNDLKKNASENIIMPGFSARVYDYLKAADYYISASDVEGLANTILESMSVGLPMLLSDIPSHREVLAGLNGKQVGYNINQHDVSDICHKVNDILNLETEEIRENIHCLYEKKYTARIMSQHYQKIYMEEAEWQNI